MEVATGQNSRKSSSTALNINVRVNFVLGGNRKLGMTNLMVMSDLTLDPASRSIEVIKGQIFRKLPLQLLISI